MGLSVTLPDIIEIYRGYTITISQCKGTKDRGVIKKSGAHYSYKDSKIGQGKDQVRQFLTDNEGLKNEIEKELINLLKNQ